MNIPDFYGVLGLTPSATVEQIEQAFRDQIKAWHPDRFATQGKEKMTAAEERTRLITKAREVLIDPERRLKYDTALQAEKNMKQQGGIPSNLGSMVRDALSWFATSPFAVKMPDENGNETDGGLSPLQALSNINSNLERLNAGLYGYVDNDGEQPGLIEAVLNLTDAIAGEDELTDQISANTDAAEEALGKMGGRKKRRKK